MKRKENKIKAIQVQSCVKSQILQVDMIVYC